MSLGLCQNRCLYQLRPQILFSAQGPFASGLQSLNVRKLQHTCMFMRTILAKSQKSQAWKHPKHWSVEATWVSADTAWRCNPSSCYKA
jgi:hypothetical protein